MNSTSGAVARAAAHKMFELGNVGKPLLAVLVMFVMVSSPFFVVVASAIEQPRIWTEKAEYLPGENVVIKGSGFLVGTPITITISHPDIATFTATVATGDGSFTYSGYVCEVVLQSDIPVHVDAYQDETHHAWTEFLDPVKYTLQAWNLHTTGGSPWTTGEIKGYNEGDTIPFNLTISRNPGDPDTVWVRIGVDYYEKGYNTTGIDFLSNYSKDPPSPPYNVYGEVANPFSVKPSQGTILSQYRDADVDQPNFLMRTWNFTLKFAPGSELAYVKFGAHLNLSDLSIGHYGAAFIHGSSLQVYLWDANPSAGSGLKKVPIAVGGQIPILTPPKINVLKDCSPEVVFPGDFINFTITINNTGQADAWNVEVNDSLPDVLDYVMGSGRMWNLTNPTKIASPPTFNLTNANNFWWFIRKIRGTGEESSSLPIFWVNISFQGRVNDDALPGLYTNWVFVNYTDDHGGVFKTEIAWCNFTVLSLPKISVTKDGPLYAYVGDVVTYTFSVTNTGTIGLENVSLVDDFFGVIASGFHLNASETRVFTVDYTILASTPDKLFNNVTATGYNRTEEVQDHDHHVLDILHTDITVTKWGSLRCAAKGDQVQYLINVTNPSNDTTLYYVEVDDTVFGLVWSGTLTPGQTVSIPLTEDITAQTPDPLINEVTANGTDVNGRNVVAGANWTVDILHPQINITKEADKICAEPGEVVTYWINVTNTATDTAMFATVWDHLLDPDDPLFAGWIDNQTTVHLGPYHYTVPNFVEWVNNTATVEAMDKQNHTVFEAMTWSVEVFHPANMIVTKEGNKACAEPGEVVTYWINVTNPSYDDTMLTVVTDPLLSGSPLFNGYLAPLEDVHLGPYYYTVPVQGVIEWVNNTVNVTAHDHQNHIRYGEATWSVEVFHPPVAMLVTKEADKACAEPGEVVTYWINVTNPSYDDAMWSVVTDQLLSPDPLYNGWIAAQQTIHLGPYYYTVPVQGVIEWVNNTVNVTAHDHQNHIRYGEASWSVEIFHPPERMLVTKEADKVCAEPGEVVTYWINVTNPSYDDAMWAVVTDPLLSSSPLFSASLAPGETVHLGPYYYTVPTQGVVEWVNNTVNVTAHDHQNHIRYGEASWSVEIFHPMDMIVTKEADKVCAEPGEVVTYWINVTNPSYDDSMHAIVTDLLISPDPLFDGLIGPLQTVYLGPYYYTVPAQGVIEWVNNTVNVTANDHQNHVRYGEASWSVEIFHPMDMLVTKEADKICAEPGEVVTYWINVTNPSYDDTMTTVVSDPLLSGAPLFDGALAPLETIHLGPYYYAVPTQGVIEWVNNTVNVTAHDHQNHIRYGEASWSVEIFHPPVMMLVTKEADKACAEPGEVVTYWINVTNPSYDDAMVANVTDLLLSSSPLYDDWIQPLQTIHLGPYYYTVPTQGVIEWVNNTVNVTAHDHQNHVRYGGASWSVEIFHPMEMAVTKEANKVCAEPGEVVTYWINVTNPSYDDAMWTIVTDPLLSGSPLFSASLGPGATVHLGPYYYTVPTQGVIEWVNNTVNVTAHDHQSHIRYGEASWSVEIFHPPERMEVTKEANVTCAAQGEAITYWINVTNPSYDDAMWTVVTDPLLSGSPLFEGSLAPGETVELGPFQYVVPTQGVVEWVNNTVNVTAHDHQNHIRYGEASWSVEILHPKLSVTKEGPLEAKMGDIITYYVNVTNIGDTPLFGIEVNDSLFNTIVVPPFDLAVGVTAHISYQYTVPFTPGDIENWVNVTGVDRQGHGASASANWTVVKLAQVTGYVFVDINQDGLMESNDVGLVGWVVTLDGETRTTDGTGYFAFLDVAPGSYVLNVTPDHGWWKNTTPTQYLLNVLSGMSYERDFGFIPLGNISGYKFFDMNMNKIWDVGESAVPGFEILLIGEDVNKTPVSLSTTTDENGYYEFIGLLPGWYNVTEVLKPGWKNVTLLTVYVQTPSLVPFNITHVDFGNVGLGRIHGFKWLDEFMNQYQDGDQNLEEPRLANWTIVLTGVLTNGTHVGPFTTTTDSHGNYYFDNLLPGEYTVMEIVPPGWYNVTPASYNVTIEPGSDVSCAKFGNVEYGWIAGWKFIDWNMNGLKDGSEPGIPGWNITLTGVLNDEEGTLVGPITIQTGPDGSFNFTHLLPGVYTISEELRDGWFNVTRSVKIFHIHSGTGVVDVKFGNVPYTCLWGYKYEDLNFDAVNESEPGVPDWPIVISGTRNDGVPVHIELETGPDGLYQTCFVLLPGRYTITEGMLTGWTNTTPLSQAVDLSRVTSPSKVRHDFGNFKFGKVYGYKFNDLNGNGIWDPGEPALANWLVSFERIEGGLSGSTLTNSSGGFEFVGLIYGHYRICEEVNPGWINTTPKCVIVTVGSGRSDPVNVTFGNFKLGIIEGYKFNDLNGNGVWDLGEVGIRGWEIRLVNDSKPGYDVQYTDGTGHYIFDGLEAGWYIVYEVVQPGWTATTPTGDIKVITSGSDYNVTFGNFMNVTICAFKFEDMDGDGIYEPWGDHPDHPLAGWNITFTGPGLGAGVTIPTNATGFACLEVHIAGDYNVTEEDRSNWTHTTLPTKVAVHVESGSDPDVVKFGNFHDIHIRVFKYEDVNSDGQYTPGVDRPIQGWLVGVLNLDSLEYYENLTGADGTYEFVVHTGGLWIIVEELQDGWCWVNTTTGYYEVELFSGDTPRTFEFGNFKCVTITVFKYEDVDSNGVYNASVDHPVAEWAFYLYDAAGELHAVNYTNGSGYATFRVCRAGNWTIVEEARDHVTPINPASGMIEVQVTSGAQIPTLMFGNFWNVKICVFKYEDKESNGRYDPGIDEPLPGWNFTISGPGVINPNATTNLAGFACFWVNRSGAYTVTEQDKVGWTHVNPANGVRTTPVTYSRNEPIRLCYGNFHNVTILVFKYDDVKANGTYDPLDGDLPIAGWHFYLYMKNATDQWVLVGSAVTNATGVATFYITSFGHYMIVEESRVGWVWITPSGGNVTFWVCSGDQEREYLFGNFKMGKIHGQKWNDTDGDGVWDPGEQGLAGWTIWFLRIGGPGGDLPLSGWTLTNSTGGYLFTDLVPGIYEVWEVNQTGWINTSPTNVITPPLWGHGDIQVDFFNFKKGCIEGYKYEDVNGNGVYDNGDRPLKNWTIYLSITTGVIEVDDHEISAIALINVTTTDEDGHFMFCGLGPGIYIVSEESREGWKHTSPTSYTVVLLSGGKNRTGDFLNFKLGKIYGYKWDDKNGNGIWDDGELPINGWEFDLINDSLPGKTVTHSNETGYFEFTGLDANWYIVYEATQIGWTPTTPTGYLVIITSGSANLTGPYGNFKNVTLTLFKYEDKDYFGVYNKGIDEPIEGWTFNISGPEFPNGKIVHTNSTGEVTVWITMGGTYTISEIVPDEWFNTTPMSIVIDVWSGRILPTQEFGNARGGTVDGSKYYDWDLDGLLDEGRDVPLSGWTIHLVGTMWNGTSYDETRTTDDSGYFTFGIVPPGTYTLSEVLPAGWTNTSSTSRSLVINGFHTHANETFTNAVLGNISGYKFYDKNLNGLMDANEPGLPHWFIHLDGTDGSGHPVHLTAETNDTGFYEFDNVQPGVYTVSEEIQDGWHNTTLGSVLVSLSSLNPFQNIVINFGNIRFACVHGFKFLDMYGNGPFGGPNGIRDPGESGLGNWNITLEGHNSTGVVKKWVLTNDLPGVPIGYYEFCGLLPGTYWVNETMQDGFYATTPISHMFIIYGLPNLGPFDSTFDFGNTVPSPDPDVPFALYKGANLWSAPHQLRDAAKASDLASLIPKCTKISKFDKATGRTVSFIPGVTSPLSSNNFAIVVGEGYYVYVSSDVTFALYGTLQPSTTTNLGKGANIVGYASLHETKASDFIKEVSGCKVTKISYFDPVSKRTKSFLPSINKAGSLADFSIAPGMAYYIYVDGPGQLVQHA